MAVMHRTALKALHHAISPAVMASLPGGNVFWIPWNVHKINPAFRDLKAGFLINR